MLTHALYILGRNFFPHSGCFMDSTSDPEFLVDSMLQDDQMSYGMCETHCKTNFPTSDYIALQVIAMKRKCLIPN